MALGILNIIWSSSKPVLKLLINAGLGVVLARTGILNQNSAKALSKMIVNLLLPCLLFGNLVRSIQVSNLGQMGILALVILFYIVIGAIWGIIYRFAFKLPRSFRNGFVAASIWGNWGDLPLSVMSTLGNSAPFRPGDAEIGVTYMSVFIVMFNLSLFTLGGYKLVESDHKHRESDQEIGTGDEKVDNVSLSSTTKGDTKISKKLKILNEASYKRGHSFPVSPVVTYSEKCLPASPPPPPIFEEPEVEEDSDERDSFDLSYYFKPQKNYHQYCPPTPGQRNITSTFNSIGSDKKNQVTTDYFQYGPQGYTACSPSTPSQYTYSRPRKGSALSSVPSFRLPSIYEAAPVRPTLTRTRTYTSISDFQPILDADKIDLSLAGKSIRTRRTYSTIGDFDKANGERENTKLHRIIDLIRVIFSPPNIAIILGLIVGLAPPLKRLFIKVSADQSEPPLSFLFELIQMIGGAYLPISLCNLGAALSRMKIRAIPLRISISFAIVKLVITPIIGIALVQALVFKLHVISPDDRALRFLAMFASCVPTATSIMVLTQFFSPDGDTKEVSAVLVIQYAFGIFTMICSLIYILHILD